MKHSQSYIICATPRSGSTLLCDLLTDTGIAGCPDSFFRHQIITWWADYFNIPTSKWDNEHAFNQSYLAAVQKEGVGETDVFGMRLMWESVRDLSNRIKILYPEQSTDRTRIELAFGPPLYIHLSRKDKVAQAVSRLKAEQSGLWHLTTDGTERERLKPGQTPVYDAQYLSEKITELEMHDAAWGSWFARQNIQPIRISYEALSTEPQTVLATVLSALGLDSTIAATVKPKTSKLADRESREWAERFRAERHKPPA